jgi:hypothetical protein
MHVIAFPPSISADVTHDSVASNQAADLQAFVEWSVDQMYRNDSVAIKPE